MTENINVKRVSKTGFRQAIEDKQVEGWKLKNESNNVAIMEKAGGWGGTGAHILIFILTGWFSLGICNLLYAYYIHRKERAEMHIKTEEQEKSQGQEAPTL